jgi:hypothetical protein
MMMNDKLGRMAKRAAFASALTLLLSGCVADAPQSGQNIGEGTAAQPRHATYDCGEDGRISVEAGKGAVRLVDAEGEVFDLPASPPSQNTRFGEGGLALVVEGGEALWMQAGKQPLTCRR